MKKGLIFVCAAGIAAVSFSAGTNKTRRVRTPEEMDALLARAELRVIGGGYIRKPGSAKGLFVVLNAQKKVAASALKPICENLDDPLAIESAVKDAEGITVGNVAEKIAAAGGTVGVALVEDSALPTLLTAPETKWAIVNVTKLAERCPDEATLASRVRKEVMRALAFTTGCAYMTMADSLMRDVLKPGDLDGLPSEKLGLEIVNRIRDTGSVYGIKPWRIATYAEACEQGWAPPPTNKYQRAAWNRVHTLPAKPLKITYDKQKQKPVTK